MGRRKMNPKRQFVLAQPAAMSAPDVVAAARKAGIELKPHSVHVIRSEERRRRRLIGEERRATSATSRKIDEGAALAEVIDFPTSRRDMEVEFIDIATTIGLVRVEELIQRLRAIRTVGA